MDLIKRLKETVTNESKFIFKDSEYCDEHIPIYNKKNDCYLYPILQHKITKRVICYVDQHGYRVDLFGRKGQPIYHYLGIYNETSIIEESIAATPIEVLELYLASKNKHKVNKPIYIEMKTFKKIS